MADWLYTLHDWTIAVVFPVLLAAPVVVLPRLLQYLSAISPNPENTDFILKIEGTLFTMSSLVLAFSLVQAQANFHQVESLIAAEASSINNLDRLLTRYGDATSAAIRPILHSYVQSIVKEEWPEMIRGGESDATRLAFIPISQRILAMVPAPGRQTLMYGEMLKSLDSIAEKRDARLASVSVALPALYWAAVFFAVGVLIVANCMIEQTLFRTVVLAAQAAVLGIFLAVVFITDQPFKGQTSVGPDAIVKVLSVMKSRDA